MQITNSFFDGNEVTVAGFITGLGKRTIKLDINQSKRTFTITNLTGLHDNPEVMNALTQLLEDNDYFIKG